MLYPDDYFMPPPQYFVSVIHVRLLFLNISFHKEETKLHFTTTGDTNYNSVQTPFLKSLYSKYATHTQRLKLG